MFIIMIYFHIKNVIDSHYPAWKLNINMINVILKTICLKIVALDFRASENKNKEPNSVLGIALCCLFNPVC